MTSQKFSCGLNVPRLGSVVSRGPRRSYAATGAPRSGVLQFHKFFGATCNTRWISEEPRGPRLSYAADLALF